MGRLKLLERRIAQEERQLEARALEPQLNTSVVVARQAGANLPLLQDREICVAGRDCQPRSGSPAPTSSPKPSSHELSLPDAAQKTSPVSHLMSLRAQRDAVKDRICKLGRIKKEQMGQSFLNAVSPPGDPSTPALVEPRKPPSRSETSDTGDTFPLRLITMMGGTERFWALPEIELENDLGPLSQFPRLTASHMRHNAEVRGHWTKGRRFVAVQFLTAALPPKTAQRGVIAFWQDLHQPLHWHPYNPLRFPQPSSAYDAQTFFDLNRRRVLGPHEALLGAVEQFTASPTLSVGHFYKTPSALAAAISSSAWSATTASKDSAAIDSASVPVQTAVQPEAGPTSPIIPPIAGSPSRQEARPPSPSSAQSKQVVERAVRPQAQGKKGTNKQVPAGKANPGAVRGSKLTTKTDKIRPARAEAPRVPLLAPVAKTPASSRQPRAVDATGARRQVGFAGSTIKPKSADTPSATSAGADVRARALSPATLEASQPRTRSLAGRAPSSKANV